jgi:SAM-dependent methyltransferase/tetratricopeptide (TPR) repeat protein
MVSASNFPLLLFYPTSPVHVSDIRLLMRKLPRWHCKAILYNPLGRVAPGIDDALESYKIDHIDLDGDAGLEEVLPADANVLVLGAAFEHFALDLFAWAKRRNLAVMAIEEVAQLALNRLDINNYDAPFDRLFVASPEERRLFLQLGYPPEMLRVAGLLANDRLATRDPQLDASILDRLGIIDGKKPIVYTTSPTRSRLALHNKDDWAFKAAVLAQVAGAARRVGRRAVIKLHPNENLEIETNKIKSIAPDAIVVGREMGVEHLFPVIGVLVNRGNSQTCLDAILRGIPTVVVACGLRTLFHDEGGAYVVEEVGNLGKAIETALTQEPPDSSGVRRTHFYLPPGGVACSVARDIELAAERSWPAQEPSWNWLIKSMLFVGRHDRALALCEQLNPAAPWQERVRLALRAHAEARLQDAIDAWVECSAGDPSWFFPHYELAHGFLASGQPKQAIDHAQTAIRLHPPYHTLWHELPMRVVIMASLRGLGDAGSAGRELEALKKRGLVEIVSELLIEAAAQYCSLDNRLATSEQCLEKALEQIESYPVHPAADGDIKERAAWQYFEVLKRWADVGELGRSFTCLQRLTQWAGRDEAWRERIVSYAGELAGHCERTGDYLAAEKCYTAAIEIKPTDPWLRYQLGRATLKQKCYQNALRALRAIVEMPGAPEQIIARVLSPSDAARLMCYWPRTPMSILKPARLWMRATAWFLSLSARLRFRTTHDEVLCLLLVWLFVREHFSHRMRVEWPKITEYFRSLTLPLRRMCSYGGGRKTSCPICNTTGTFEYRNKLTPLLRCPRCDHVFASRLPTDNALNALYGDFSYWEKDRYHQGITAIEQSEQWNVYLTARIGILHKLQLLEDPQRPLRRVFEIGCAEGMLLHELSKRGLEVTGCEMNRAVAEKGMKKLGVDIHTMPFECVDLPAKSFDLVMSFHTLEHMKFPAEVIRKVADILCPDGAILLEVPYGKVEYENTDHLHFFSETSLRLLLSRFFVATEILPNSYTNSTGVQIGSFYAMGRGVRGAN